jgi:hypothetical protein
MARTTLRVALTLCIGIFLSFIAAHGALAICTSNAQCSGGNTCQPSGVPFIKECRFTHCNTDLDCPASGPLCLLGECAPGCFRDSQCVGSTNTCAGAGITPGTCVPRGPASGIPGEGAACGEVRFGSVIKHLGCKRQLECKFGRCQRIPT